MSCCKLQKSELVINYNEKVTYIWLYVTFNKIYFLKAIFLKTYTPFDF